MEMVTTDRRASYVTRVVALVLTTLLSACATGPSLSTIETHLKPPGPGQGRIYFYRDGSPLGAAVQPSVLLSGEPIGRATSGGVFFADRPPGKYIVSIQTEVEKTLPVELRESQSQYVRLEISMGFLVGRIIPVLVDAATGAAEAGRLSFAGGSQAEQPTATAAVAANRSPDSPIARYRPLSRGEVSGLMNRPWEFVRPTDNDRIRWEFSGSTVYATNITSPGRYSGDWRFNQRNEVCVETRSRRSPDRCVAVARDGENFVLIDSDAPNAVFSVLELR